MKKLKPVAGLSERIEKKREYFRKYHKTYQRPPLIKRYALTDYEAGAMNRIDERCRGQITRAEIPDIEDLLAKYHTLIADLDLPHMEMMDDGELLRTIRHINMTFNREYSMARVPIPYKLR